MAQAIRLKPFILRWEGGFVNDPSDLGGATNKGVTIGAYEAYCKRKGYPKPTIERLKRLSESEWLEIFKTMYWDRFKADDIASQSVANICVDWLWASGVHAIKRVQRIVGVTADGVVGPQTISAINSKSPLPLFGQIKQARLKFVDEICKARPANERFRKGWLNRINAIKYEE